MPRLPSLSKVSSWRKSRGGSASALDATSLASAKESHQSSSSAETLALQEKLRAAEAQTSSVRVRFEEVKAQRAALQKEVSSLRVQRASSSIDASSQVSLPFISNAYNVGEHGGNLCANDDTELSQLKQQVAELQSEVAELRRASGASLRWSVGNPDGASEFAAGLQELQSATADALAPLLDALRAADELRAAHEGSHATAKLPPDLKAFRPLAQEERITDAAEGLSELELAVARSPQSEAAVCQLRSAVGRLAGETRDVIMQRTQRGDETALLKQCEITIAAGNKDFLDVYDGVFNVIRSGEGGALADYDATLIRLHAVATGEAKQRDEAADVATLFADAVLAKPAFDVVLRAVSEATGTKLELASLIHRSQGKEVSGLKRCTRIVEKVQLRPGDGRGRSDRVCDVCRAMLIASDMAGVAAISNALIALSNDGVVTVRRIKDRFATPTAGGWRDLMVNVVIADDPRQHVCEVQISHEMMLTARKGLPGHAIYAIVRNASELIESCGKELELRRLAIQTLRDQKATVLEMVAGGPDEWIARSSEWMAAAGGKTELATRIKVDVDGCVDEVAFDSVEHITHLPDSVGQLQSLTKLDVACCTSLQVLPEALRTCRSLKVLDASLCDALKGLPTGLGSCPLLAEIDLTHCKFLEALPEEICDAPLQVMDLSGCDGLKTLPTSIGRLKTLEKLHLDGCKSLTSLPMGITELSGLEVLELCECPRLKALPARLDQCSSLRQLALSDNPWLKSLPACVGKLEHLRELLLSNCRQLLQLPDDIGDCKQLHTLNVSSCKNLKELPNRLSQCSSLASLELCGCKGLKRMPDLSNLASQLKFDDITEWTPFLQMWRRSPNNLRSLAWAEYAAYAKVARKAKASSLPESERKAAKSLQHKSSQKLMHEQWVQVLGSPAARP